MDEKKNGSMSCLLHLMNSLRAANGDTIPAVATGHGEAGAILLGAQRLGVQFLPSPTDLANARIRSAFVIAVFNQAATLERRRKAAPLDRKMNVVLKADDTYKPKTKTALSGDQREEEAFRMWINSLDLTLRAPVPKSKGRTAAASTPVLDSATATTTNAASTSTSTCTTTEPAVEVYVHNLVADCKDGLVFLAVLDRVQPGLVDWAQVALNADGQRFRMISNCNYLVECCKKLGFSLIGVQGSDIVDGNKKLQMGLVWQMMRTHVIAFLTNLHVETSGSGNATSSSSSSSGSALSGGGAGAAAASRGRSDSAGTGIIAGSGGPVVAVKKLAGDGLERTLLSFANDRIARAAMINGQPLPS
jgi:hypothetical protein